MPVQGIHLRTLSYMLTSIYMHSARKIKGFIFQLGGGGDYLCISEVQDSGHSSPIIFFEIWDFFKNGREGGGPSFPFPCMCLINVYST